MRKDQLKLMEYLIEGVFSDTTRARRNFWKRIGEREDISKSGIIKSQLETVEQLDLKQPRHIERMVIGDILNNIRVTANNPNQIRSKYYWFT